MPFSTAVYAIENNGPGLEKEMKCESLPEEACLCFDSISAWETAKIVTEDDQTTLIDDSDKLAIYQQKVVAEMTAKIAMDAIKKAEDCGQNAKRFLKSRVILRGLNAQQISQALVVHANAMKLLEEGALDPAISLIQATESDGVILTDDDKTQTIAFINSCKG